MTDCSTGYPFCTVGCLMQNANQLKVMDDQLIEVKDKDERARKKVRTG